MASLCPQPTRGPHGRGTGRQTQRVLPGEDRDVRRHRARVEPLAAEIAGVRRLLWIEVALFALLPVFAAALARGFGELGS
jgi:hypothetical protein